MKLIELEILFNNNGPIGLESIAALREDASMLEFVVEPINQLGFISRTPREENCLQQDTDTAMN